MTVNYAPCLCLVVLAVVVVWGGQTKPHAYAQEDAWEKILAFLQQHLYYGTNVVEKAHN